MIRHRYRLTRLTLYLIETSLNRSMPTDIFDHDVSFRYGRDWQRLAMPPNYFLVHEPLEIVLDPMLAPNFRPNYMLTDKDGLIIHNVHAWQTTWTSDAI